MHASAPGFGFLAGRHARILTAVLLAQGALFYALSRGEAVPIVRPLAEFPGTFDGWRLFREGVIEQEILDVLRADDLLNRVYMHGASGQVASLFVAYFKSQRTGQAPHSPKNCLPGAGWVPSASEIVSIAVPDRPEPVEVNRYIVSKGDEKSVVLYWYQTRGRVIASEYRAKVHLVVDSVRYNRSDTALVRVVVPVRDNNDAAAAKAAVEFVQSFFSPLRAFLPS
jgi:EpsI family protein